MRLADVKSTDGVDLNKRNINSRLRDMAAHLRTKHEGKAVTLVPILRGSWFTATDLLRHMNPIDPKKSVFESTFFEPIQCTSYMDDPANPGTMAAGDCVIRVLSLKEESVYGRVVIPVDDIIDTGRTMKSVVTYLQALGAAVVEPTSLLTKAGAFKPEHAYQYDPALQGFEVDKFVVGYGLDWNGLYRERSRLFHLIDD